MKPQPLEWVSCNCDCKSARHTIRFVFDPENGDLFVDVQLAGWLGFWKRCWVSLLYILGRADTWSHWDCTLLTKSADQIAELCRRSVEAQHALCVRGFNHEGPCNGLPREDCPQLQVDKADVGSDVRVGPKENK